MLTPDAIFFGVCLLTGVVSGFVGGLLGLGGGMIIVPVLIFLYDFFFDVPKAAHLAVGTSLSVVLLTSLSASYTHYKKAAVDWSPARLWVIPLIVGSFSAGLLADFFTGRWLTVVVAICMMVFAGIFIFNRRLPAHHPRTPATSGVVAVATAIGLVSGLAGVGGGNLIVPSLIYWLGLSFVFAAALSSLLIIPVAFFGALGFILSGWLEPGRPLYSLGYIHLPATFAIALGAVLFAPAGVKVAYLARDGTLKTIFAVVLMGVSCGLLWSSFRDF